MRMPIASGVTASPREPGNTNAVGGGAPLAPCHRASAQTAAGVNQGNPLPGHRFRLTRCSARAYR